MNITEAHMFDFGEGKPDVFIQWKGTTVCCDFHCECGVTAHLCGVEFMYRIRCHGCGVVWELPNPLPLRKAKDQAQQECTIDAIDDREPVDPEPK